MFAFEIWSIEIAEELTQLNINQNSKLIPLDIKDLYTNLPKQGITMATRHWLQQPTIDHEESKQIILLINTIMEQNYFQYNNQYFKPQKGIIMGSPLSGTLAELYLQKIEKDNIKQWLDSNEISYYKRYVDDTFYSLLHAGRSSANHFSEFSNT